jgi:hypothetical protein
MQTPATRAGVARQARHFCRGYFCCGSSASKSAIFGAAAGFIMPTT